MRHTSAGMVPEVVALPDHQPAALHLVYDERCDACPGLAVVVVHLSSGRELVLCGNHARRFAPQLLEGGATIVGDYSWDAGSPPALDIRVPLPPDDAAKPQGRGEAVRTSRWQHLLGRFKNS